MRRRRRLSGPQSGLLAFGLTLASCLSVLPFTQADDIVRGDQNVSLPPPAPLPQLQPEETPPPVVTPEPTAEPTPVASTQRRPTLERVENARAGKPTEQAATDREQLREEIQKRFNNNRGRGSR